MDFDNHTLLTANYLNRKSSSYVFGRVALVLLFVVRLVCYFVATISKTVKARSI